MTTTDTSFVAQGAASGLGVYPIGFYANSKGPRPIKAFPPFQVGALGVGQAAGVYGATDTVAMPRPGQSLPGVSDFGSAGVWGYAVNTSGVAGYAAGSLPFASGPGGLPPAGVLGASDNYYGVYGYAPGNPYPGSGIVTAGVYGDSKIGFGVQGWSDAGFGVYGESAGSYGVSRWSQTESGVYGQAGFNPGPVPTLVNIAGVIGSSDQQAGIIGTSNGIGIYGYSGNTNAMKAGIGVYAHADRALPNNYAGVFDGNVSVIGTFSANVKNAVVPFPDGTQRVLHCMESPEHWFEDFGAAKLKRGRTVVKLEADFAKVIKRGDYKVFLTPEGDCRGLYVRKSAASFQVREFGGGTSSVAFSYRIVGRRKDIRGHRRFAKIHVKQPLFPRSRRPVRGKLLVRSRNKGGATPSRRRGRGRGKRA